MTTPNIIKPEAIFTEAPASWNTSYVTPEGYVCRITLRGETGKDLLERASIALAFLQEHGYLPEQRSPRSNGGEARQCPIHKRNMHRYEKDGKSWFSHKTEDGTWCCGEKK